MGRKVIFVLVDALNYETAYSAMGFMNHLVEMDKASLFEVKAGLPTLSRPLYESILTGTNCIENGITSNQSARLSSEKSIFHLCCENNLKTGAAAYYWMSELYNSAPFNYIRDREQFDEKANIQFGKFYFEDSYPDSHLIIDGEVIREKYNPDFLLIHPMGMDYVGHKYGSDSKEYRMKVIEIDCILANIIPLWMSEGYDIIVSADHGMDSLGLHNGTSEKERKVPLFVVSDSLKPGYHDEEMSQLLIAPLICKLLGIEKSKKMRSFDSSILVGGGK